MNYPPWLNFPALRNFARPGQSQARFGLLTLLVVLWPRELRAADQNWAAYLGDAGASHYSTLRNIDRTNVARLTPAWTFRSGDATTNSQIQCNPLVIDGVLFGTSPKLKLFALDAATGREMWTFDPFAGSADSASSRGLNRGLALWREGDQRRILFTAGNFLHAVDPATGKLIDTFGEHGRVDLLQGLDRDTRGLYLVGTSPGAVYRDLIIVSARLSEGPGPAAPGHIRAYDVRTGERRWIFHTIPHPGEEGYETWPADAWREIGAANNWCGMTIDQERGVAFIPTGSAAFDFWGGNRVGANLYANCLLALDASTGKRKWHFQFVHHDLWDRDLPAAPTLCTVTRNGKKIPAVAQITKSGHVWVFNRETGESLFPWREEPVPPSALEGEVAARTQPRPLQPEPFARQQFTEAEVTDRTPAARAAILARLREAVPHVPFSPPSTRGTVILPGFDGGGEWGGAAVDPDGILYVNGNEMAWILQMVPTRAPAGATLGQALYTQLCISCHGPDRAGNAAANVPTLVNLAAKMKPADVATLLRTGRAVMPAFAYLTNVQRTALVDFLLDTEPATGSAAGLDPRGAIASAGDTKPTTIPFTTTGYRRFLDSDGYPALRPPWGTLNALDLNTGEYRWRRPLGELPELTAAGISPTGTENYGGPLVTAGGLVFIAATKDEKFRAFDSATGKQLWETALPAGGYATPATYSIDGRQFVVIACGGGKMGTKSGDAYVAFALP
jgi:quinoprotein glucose dehydrogenase